MGKGWAIALHGGAGDIPINLPQNKKEPRESALLHCLQLGISALKNGRSPLDVVELVVPFLFSFFSIIFVDFFLLQDRAISKILIC